ncbi:hypothetical protein [Tannerella forsythia]
MDCGPACLTMIAQNEYCIMFF